MVPCDEKPLEPKDPLLPKADVPSTTADPLVTKEVDDSLVPVDVDWSVVPNGDPAIGAIAGPNEPKEPVDDPPLNGGGVDASSN